MRNVMMFVVMMLVVSCVGDDAAVPGDLEELADAAPAAPDAHEHVDATVLADAAPAAPDVEELPDAEPGRDADPCGFPGQPCCSCDGHYYCQHPSWTCTNVPPTGELFCVGLDAAP